MCQPRSWTSSEPPMVHHCRLPPAPHDIITIPYRHLHKICNTPGMHRQPPRSHTSTSTTMYV